MDVNADLGIFGSEACMSSTVETQLVMLLITGSVVLVDEAVLVVIAEVVDEFT